MKQLFLAAAIGSCIAPLTCLGQTTVFSDNFSTSTLNGANTTPTSTSTGYQIASTKSTTGSAISAGDLKMTFGSTSSGIAEIQALFATSPVSLQSIGDSIDLNISFVNTSGLLPGPSSFLAGGLYNSAGSAPVNNGQLASSGIGGTTFPTGNAANWQGYVGIVRPSTTSSTIVTRPVQQGTAATPNTDQELIGNSFSTSGGYNNPAGSTIHSLSATVSLTAGETLNYDLKITLTAASTLSIVDTLTQTGTTPTTLFQDTGTATGANFFTPTFDGLAFGDRDGTAGSANTVDISQITVTDNLAAPEPSTFALCGLGIAAFAAMRRFRK